MDIMDYRKHYDLLMDKARLSRRAKGLGEYYERHHIIPKSEGGTDDDDNLVLLTAREHFVAHFLLWMESPTESAARSFWFMCQDIERRQVTISSRAYAIAREAVVEANRTGQVKECYICGKPHYRKLHTLTNARGHYYCSKSCFGKIKEKHKKPNEGWTDESIKSFREKRTGRIQIHYPPTGKSRQVWPNEWDWFEDAGWKKGTGVSVAAGKKWYNNGTKQAYFAEGLQPEGWELGRTGGTTNGRQAISKDGVVKFVIDVDPWLAEGWELGNEKYYPGYLHRK